MGGISIAPFFDLRVARQSLACGDLSEGRGVLLTYTTESVGADFYLSKGVGSDTSRHMMTPSVRSHPGPRDDGGIGSTEVRIFCPLTVQFKSLAAPRVFRVSDARSGTSIFYSAHLLSRRLRMLL